MTSKSSYSKSGTASAFCMTGRMMREDFKRRLWTIAMVSLVFFFMLPVGTAMYIGNAELNNGDVQSVLWLQKHLLSHITLDNGFLQFLTFVLPVVFGVTSFSYLHSRKKVDFYHSIPVRREVLFAAHYIDGILIPAAAYLIGIGAALAVIGINNLGNSQMAVAALITYGIFMLHYILLYSVMVLAMILTGNLVVGILGAGVLNGLVPAFLAMFSGYFSEFFVTSYNSGPMSFVEFWIDKLSPAALTATNYSKIAVTSESMSWESMTWYLLGAAAMAAALTILSIILYRKRGSEATGKAMAFAVSRPVFRIPVVILSSMAAGLFFWSANYHMGWAAFGLLCGLLLSHCTIEILYHFDFRKLFSARISLAACGGAAVLIFCGFRYDLVNYDSYLPAKEQLESVSMFSNNLDGWVDAGRVNASIDGSYTWDDEFYGEYALNGMELTDMDLIYPYLQRAVELGKQWNWRDADDIFDTNEYFHDISIRYRLKSGKEVTRNYYFYDDEACELLKQIHESTAFKQGTYPILKRQPEDVVRVRVRKDEQFVNAVADNQKLAGDFLLTYQEEFMALTSKDMELEQPVGAIQFMTPDMADAVSFMEKNKKNNYYYDNLQEKELYPVYPSFTKTLALLEEAGIVIGDSIAPEIVDEVRVDPSIFETEYGECDRSIDVVIEDPSDIEVLLARGISLENSDMNAFYEMNDAAELNVVYKSGKNMSSSWIIIDKADIPASVLERIQEEILANPPDVDSEDIVRAEAVY